MTESKPIPFDGTEAQVASKSATYTLPKRTNHPDVFVLELTLFQAEFNRRYKRLMAFYEKRNRSRFKLLRSPEESDRITREHLQRIYGDKAVAASLIEKQPAPSSVSDNHSKPRSAIEKDPVPTTPTEHKDIIAVPLVRLPNGFLGLDYAAAKIC